MSARELEARAARDTRATHKAGFPRGLMWLLAAAVLIGLIAFMISRARRGDSAVMAPDTDVPELNAPELPAAPKGPPPRVDIPPAPAKPEAQVAPPEGMLGEPEAKPETPPATDETAEVVVLSEASGPSALVAYLGSNEPPPRRFILDVVEFGTTSTTVPESAVLDGVADALMERPGAKVRLDGYTDDVGSEASNKALSRRRAQQVKNYLVERGVAAERIEAAGQGESQPISSNDSPEDRAKNRRVELVILNR